MIPVNKKTAPSTDGHRRSILLLGIICLLLASQGFAGRIAAAEEEEELQKARERYRARKTWEKIVSLPGEIIYFPFRVLFQGTAATVAYIDEKKIVARIGDVLESDDGRRALKPTYSARYGAGFKVHQKGLFNRESKMSLSATAGLRWRQRYQISLEKVRLFDGFGHLTAHYLLLSDESFFGLGPGSSTDEESNYAHEQAALAAGFGKDHGEFLSWTVQARLEMNNILEGRDDHLPLTTDLYTGQTLPGVDRQVKIVRLNLQGVQDTRNRLGNPSSGGRLALDAGIAAQLGDERFGFWQIEVDATRYYHLFYQRILALRVGGSVMQPSSGRQIPFYELSELGRRETVRGYRRGRYRDRDMVLATAEYRFPLRTRPGQRIGLDAFLFLDAGQVCPNLFDRIAMDAFQTGFGCGLRLYGQDGEILRFEVGRGEEKVRFYLVLN